MDSEAKQKLYEVHGTVSELNEKTDHILEKQEELEGDIDQLEEDIDEVDQQASDNQRRLYGLFTLGGVSGTVAIILATVYSGSIP